MSRPIRSVGSRGPQSTRGQDAPMPACATTDGKNMPDLAPLVGLDLNDDPRIVLPLLFDATHNTAHQAARNICRGCPLYGRPCQDRYEATARDAYHGASCGPQGTWNGRLYGVTTKTLPSTQRTCALDGCGVTFIPSNRGPQKFCSDQHRRKLETLRAKERAAERAAAREAALIPTLRKRKADAEHVCSRCPGLHAAIRETEKEINEMLAVIAKHPGTFAANSSARRVLKLKKRLADNRSGLAQHLEEAS